MVTTALALMLLADLMPGPPPRQPTQPPVREATRPTPTNACAVDDDCVMASVGSCCGSCCPEAPVAVSRTALAAHHQECGRHACAPGRDCGPVKCLAPPSEPRVARCRARRCVAEPAPPPAAECREDRDCRVVHAPPPDGGCCPVARAVPVEAVVPLTSPAGPPGTTQAAKPPFGLSQGGPPVVPPTCACPPPPRWRALCRQQRCELAPPSGLRRDP